MMGYIYKLYSLTEEDIEIVAKKPKNYWKKPSERLKI